MLSLKKFTDANTGIDVFINPAVVSHVAAYRRWSSRDEAFILDGTLIHLTEFEQRVHVKEPVGYVVATLQGTHEADAMREAVLPAFEQAIRAALIESND